VIDSARLSQGIDIDDLHKQAVEQLKMELSSPGAMTVFLELSATLRADGKPFDLIFTKNKTEEWRAQGDDFYFRASRIGCSITP
jgi:hypothetical protein